MKIEIDNNSGFCFGVVNAIRKAENHLDTAEKLYCLGDIVHNNKEVERLNRLGLVSINREQFSNTKECTVLVRAHGEPPETYKVARKNNIKIIEATCPVVLTLQKKVQRGYEKMKALNGQLVIFGKQGHAEVVGLVGHTEGKAIVVNDTSDLSKLDYSRPISLFAQTTKDQKIFEEIQNIIKKRMAHFFKEDELPFFVTNSICRQVSERDKAIKHFAGKHNVVVFVSGKKSSNGRMLYEICKTVNSNTYFVSDQSEIELSWFKASDSVGICGATSTPRWLMEEIREKLNQTFD
ncbi:MAG: 4-hydroxy-3-methylbut-2-enyl diphosphate reductase [Marinilabiliales bacterium]|nr:MAG: 4-hydroxy-3-methylbut-2-enyl diphosphate reductase [Marinilabiliales bacterium]